MDGAHGVLLSIYGGSDLGLFEINEAASLVAAAAHPDANIIFGAVIDDTLGDEVRVTVIAAGFDSGQLPYKKVEPRRDMGSNSGLNGSGASGVSSAGGSAMGAPIGHASTGWTLPSTGLQRVPVNVEEDLDVPDFLK